MPAVEAVDLATVFGELVTKPHWVGWRHERNKGGEWKKPPTNPKTGGHAMPNKPETWGTRAMVRGDNVGLVLSEAVGLVAGDLDGVRNALTGEVPHPWVREFIAKANTYVEVSPSGTGFRFFWRCRFTEFPGGKRTLAGHIRRFGSKLPDGTLKDHPTEFELFSDFSAYVTVTGQHVVGTPAQPAEGRAQVMRLSAWVAEVAHQGKPAERAKADTTTEAEVREALRFLDDDTYRRGQGQQSWLLVGMALHAGEASGELRDGLTLWREWSQRFRTDCTEATFQEKWRSFKAEKGLGLGSIFHWAAAKGWKRPKKTKDRPREEDDDTYAFNVINAAGVQPEHQEWLWCGRIPMGALTLLVALPGEGKSHVFVDIVARYTTGRVMPNGENEAVVFQLPPGRAVIFCTEDSIKRTLVPRLMAAGAELARVDFIQYLKNEKGEERGLDITRDVPRLAAHLKAYPDARLVIFDPISESLGTKIDSHNNTSVRAACAQLVRMLGEHNIAGIGVSHLPKTKSGSIKTAAIGSIAFSALARSQLWVTDELDVTTDPETGARKTEATGRKLLFLSKANLAPDDRCRPLAFTIAEHELRINGSDVPLFTSRIGWGGEVEATSVDYWGGGAEGGGGAGNKPKAIDEAALFIREMMLDKEKSTRDKPVFRERLADDVKAEAEGRGISQITLRRARQRLGITPHKREGDGKFVWDVPSAWRAQQGDLPF